MDHGSRMNRSMSFGVRTAVTFMGGPARWRPRTPRIGPCAGAPVKKKVPRRANPRAAGTADGTRSEAGDRRLNRPPAAPGGYHPRDAEFGLQDRYRGRPRAGGRGAPLLQRA